jgi:hypothetical protein
MLRMRYFTLHYIGILFYLADGAGGLRSEIADCFSLFIGGPLAIIVFSYALLKILLKVL